MIFVNLPAKRPAIAEVKDLMRVEELSEARDELEALASPAFTVDENEKWAYRGRKHGRLHGWQQHHCIIKTKINESPSKVSRN